MEAYFEYESTKEGTRMRKLLEALQKIAVQFCELHGITCCNRRVVKHSHYQCKYNSDPIIACYREDECLCPDIEEVEKYIAYVGAHEIDSRLNKFLATSHVAREMKGQISIILQICKKEFSDNIYVKERILAATESTNILPEEEDKNLSLGTQHENMPFTLMHAWKEIKKCPKWQDIYEVYKKEHKLGTKEGSSVVDLEEGDEGKKGQKGSKADFVRGANVVAFDTSPTYP